MTWALNGNWKNVYLTFDDGPTPKVTDWVLDRLKEYDARATFFCLGRNVDAHPDIFRRVLDDGHAVGNHTYSHLKGYSSSTQRYMDDVRIADTLIRSRLFRPPYGRIRPRQVKAVNGHFDIIMWSVLSVDYNRKLSGDRVAENVIRNVRPGSIVVFHDSDKARKNLFHALPRVLEYLKNEGYTMRSIGQV
jgi:peptidoglycan/xylan/chitin deacetylase (PgdA/CDA1 family)